MTRYFVMGTCAIALALGCSDATDAGGGDAAVASDMGITPDGGAIRPPVGARSLEIVGEADVAAARDSMVEIQALFRDQMGPIGGANLNAFLLDATGRDTGTDGVEGTFLQGRRVVTGMDGVGTFQVNTGARDVVVKVRIEAPDAPPVTATVTVLREGAGGLRVDVEYDEGAGRYTYANLGAAQVYLFDRIDCATLAGSAGNLQGAYFTLPEIAPFNEVSDPAVAGDLDDGTVLQVVATATSNAGGVVAFGCVDGVTVVGGEVTRVEVPLTDLRLEFKGTYDVVHRFDLTDMLRNTEMSSLATIAQVLDVLRIVGDGEGDRGQAIVDLFCEFADVSPGTCNLLDGIGARLIDEVIGRVVPANVLAIFTILSDVIGIFTDLTVVGQMQLDSVFEDGLIPNNDNRWQKFRWTWRDGCPDGEACTREFALGDLNVNDRPIFGTFDAQLNGGVLTINAHDISFRYGLIILEMAQNWVLPRLVDDGDGRTTVEELFEAILPCDAINEGLTGSAEDDLCQNVLVASLAEIVTDQLSALEFSANEFTISGSVTPLDMDGDLTIDTLSMGAWSGQLAITDPPLVFGGCFEGCRPGAEGACEPASCNPE